MAATPKAPTDAERASALYASLLDAAQTPKQADAARRLGMRGTSFRDVTRGLGVYVSKGGAFDDATRKRVLATGRIVNAAAKSLGVDVDTVKAVFAPTTKA